MAEEYNELGKHVAAGAGFVSNLVLWSEVGYFNGAAHTKPLLHLWSLGVEEQFYIVWPLILWFGWRLRLNLWVLSLILTIVSFGINLEISRRDVEAAFYAPHTRFWELSCGGLLAWHLSGCKNNDADESGSALFRKLKLSCNSKWCGSALFEIISIIGVSLLAGGLLMMDDKFVFPGGWALVPVLGAVCIIVAGPKAWFNRIFLSNPILVWFGVISFPLYLWHWPILTFGWVFKGGLPSGYVQLTCVFASILLSWLTVKYVEAPLRFGEGGWLLRRYFCVV